MRRNASAQVQTTTISSNHGYYKQSRRTKGIVNKMALHEKENSSPVSPLQFGMDDSLAADFHSSCTSSPSNIASDEDLITFVGSPRASNLSLDYANIPDILKVQQHLRSSLDKAKDLHSSLIKSDSKLRNVSYRMFDSENAVASWHAKSNTTTDLIDIALAQAVDFVKNYDAEHDIKRAVGEGPKGIDAQSYVHYIELLEAAIRSDTCSTSSLSLHHLQEAIQILIKSSLLDNLWIARLNRIVTVLQKMQASLHEENNDLELLDASSQHLIWIWKTILTDYGMITPLPVALPNSTEKVKPPPPPPPLSPHLVLTLREIIQKLASAGTAKTCIEIYKDIRSSKANESLQTLCPDYLQFCTSEAIDKLDWMDLEDYIVLWRQHLEVLINVLLTVEYDLCRQVFSSSLQGSVWRQCFGKLSMQAGLESFLHFSEAVARSSQKDPQKLFKLLDMVGALEDVKLTLEELFANEISCNEVMHRLHDIRSLLVCAISKAFRKFRIQVDLQSHESIPLDGGVLELCTSTLTSVSNLITDSNEPILNQAVVIEQNEKGQNSDGLELSHAILHMLKSLERRVVDGVAGTSSRDQAFSYLFLMNNYWYIHVTLRKNTKLASLLGDECLKGFREKAKEFAHKYQREAWASILQYLGKEGTAIMGNYTENGNNGKLDMGKEGALMVTKGGNYGQGDMGTEGSWMVSQNDNKGHVDIGKEGTLMITRRGSNHGGGSLIGSLIGTQKGSINRKVHVGREGSLKDTKGSTDNTVQLTLELQRVRAFQVAFEGVYQRHKGWKIPDAELRERIGKAVVRLVVPAYGIYLKSLACLMRQSKAHVQLKYSMDMMQELLTTLFQGNLSMSPDQNSDPIFDSDALMKKSRSTNGLASLHDGIFQRSYSTTAGVALGIH